MIRAESRAKVWAFVVLALLCASILLLPARTVASVVDVDEKINGIDISNAPDPLASTRAVIIVHGPLETDRIELAAKGPGPSYYWSVFSFRNVTDAPLDFVVMIDGQYFSGSASLKVPPAGPKAISAVLTKNSQSLPIFNAGWAQAIQIHVLPHDSTNVAVETSSPSIPASLWQSAAFEAFHADHTYYIGLAEGVMLLVVMGLLGLYAYGRHRAALAGAFLAAACLIFVDVGVNSFVGKILPVGLTPNLIRAVAESLMVVALALCAGAFMGRQVFGGWWQRIMVVVAVLALANLGYGLAEPLAATLLARIAFVLLALVAAIVGLRMRKAGREIVDPSGILWLSLLGWLVVVAAVAYDQSHSAIRAPQLAIATAALLVALAVVMFRGAATLRLSARPFADDANLRSLALSAGRHIMWDWLPEERKLEISGELERSLGLALEQTADSRLKQFYSAMHPLDLGAYKKLAERLDFKPGERLQLELRLQHGDGIYHWYELQARAVPGPGNTVDRCIGTLTSISSLKIVEERLANDALHDAVSGLPNKALFIDRVDRSLAKLGALPLRVIIIDIDRFKTLNEGLGQDVGDRILKVTADRMVGFVEDNETVARMNGGQFALECAEIIDRGDFIEFVATLQAQLTAPIKHGSQQIVLSTSVGVSMSGMVGVRAQDLIDQASVAMLEARGEGGARAQFYHAELKDDRA
ncbi:MAG: sensor domain-containing diguanylate cyclase, partial [Aestuariivirga sp.]